MPLKLNVAHTEDGVRILGPFSRFCVWVHGCPFDCSGCLADGMKNGPFYQADASELARKAALSGCEGVTVSGGEPFFQPDALAEFLSAVKSSRDIGVIAYTGYTYEELHEDPQKRAAAELCDLIIDGRYVKELDDGRTCVGSSNQRLWHNTPRYEKIAEEYYGGFTRSAEIRLTHNLAVLIGVPSRDMLEGFKKLTEKYG